MTFIMLFILTNFSIGQIAVNSFESSGDSWTPLTFSTVPCTNANGSDQWDYDTALSSITPSDGSQFWGIRDLCGNCGGCGYESITHPSLDISAYTDVTISFDYYTIGYENADNLGYEIWEDGIKVVDLVDLNDNSGGWLTVTYNVSASVTNVYLVLKAKQNGDDDYGGFDNVEVNGTPAGPSISINTISLTGFTYQEGSGPSAEQSFTVEGTSLTNDIDITPPVNWEISLTPGGPFQTSAITLAESGGVVNSTTIYTRMVTGLLEVNSPFSGNIACASTGATTQNIAVDGTVTLACVTPSNQATALTFLNITSSTIDVAWTPSSPASDNYLVVQSISPSMSSNPIDGTSYAITDAIGGGTVVFNGSGTSFTDSALAENTTYYYFVFSYNNSGCTGGPLYLAPALIDNETTAAAPSYCANVDFTGAGNSGSYSTVTWTDAGISWQGTDARGDQDLNSLEAITLRNGSLTNTTVVANGMGTISFDYARVFSGNSTLQVLVNGIQYGGDITVSNTTSTNFSFIVNVSGNISLELSNSGNRTVINNLSWTCYASVSPTIAVTPSSLTGFSYVEGSGPSLEQNFTIEGTNLTNDIIITPPANWGISLTLGGPYQTTPITLAQAGGTVGTTTIYTVMLGGLTQGSSPYSGNITCESTGATTINVAVDGTVTSPPPPSISVTPASLTGFNYVEGSGPSAQQSFTIEGSNLTNDIDIIPPASWEISLTSGGPFQTSAITLAELGGVVNSTTIYTRMVTGLLEVNSPFSGNIACASTGATQNIAVDGTVTPLCTIPTAQPTGLNYSLVTSTQIDGSFTASSPASDEYLVVQSLNPTLSGTPVDGTTYIAGNSLGGGTVVQSSSNLSFSVTGLSPLTTYYYYIFSYNNTACSGGPMYMTSSPLEGNTTTLNPPCVEEDFVDFSDWIDNGTITDNVATHYGAAAPCRGFGSGDNMITPSVDYPNHLQFHQDASGSGNGNNATIEYQIASGGWIPFHTFTVTSSGATESIDLTNLSGIDLSAEFDVTFRFNSITSGTWYLDDVVVECSSCSPTHTITSFAPNSGPVGTEFVITGTGFTAGSTVSINGTLANIIAQTSTEIIAEVTTGSTTGVLSVTEAGCILLSTDFTVDAATGICYGGSGFTDVYISEIYDSESGNLGYIELHNPTGTDIDLDLPGTGYFIKVNSNPPINLTGTIAANSTFIIKVGNSGSSCAPTVNFNGPATGINDNDTIYLEKNGINLDHVDTPSELGFTMERNGDAVGPTTTFDLADWSSNSSESCAGLGNPTTVFPTISPLIDQNICIPNFSVNANASAGGTLTYEWFYNDGTTWSVVNATNLPGLTLSGETTNSLTISPAGSPISSIDNYQFYVEVTEGGTCTNVSNAAMYSDPGGCFICPTLVTDIILDENFDSGNLSAWYQQAAGEWGTYSSGQAPQPYAAHLNGIYSVRQYFDSNSDLESSFGYKYDDCLAGVTTTWKFQMYNNSNPSLENYFLVYLTNNSETTTQSTGTGYAIGVRPSVVGDHDYIELFKIVDGAVSSTIINTGIAWQSTAHGDPFLPNNKVGIEVTRSENGTWGVKLDVDGGFDNLVSYGTPAINTDFYFTESFVVYRKHTGSTENTIMIDDVFISQTGCEITYYSQETGNSSGTIWADQPVGTAQSIIPGKFTRLVVQDGHYVTLDEDITCDDLAITSLGTLDATDKTICINGDFLVPGTFIEGTSYVNFNGKVTQLINTSSSLKFYDVALSNPAGVNSSSTFDIINAVFPEEGIFDVSGGNMTLISNATGTASIGEIKSGASIVGDINVERYVLADTGTDEYPGGWVGISTPVQGKTIADWNTDLITTGFPGSDYPDYAYPGTPVVLFNNIIKWDPALGPGGEWVGAQGLGDTISTSNGYFVYMQQYEQNTHLLGTFHQGSLTQNLSYNGSGWNLITNPYPCPVDWDKLYNASSNIGNTYHVYDSDANVYVNYTAGSSPNHISASQSFWVQASNASAVLEWEESQKVIDGVDVWERDQIASLGFNIILSQERILDNCYVGFRSDATENFDASYDSHKLNIPMPGTSSAFVSTLLDDIELENNVQGEVIGEVSIPIFIEVNSLEVEYTLTFKGMFTMEDYCVILEDTELGIFTPISEYSSYEFVAEENTDRFIIHISQYLEDCIENEVTSVADVSVISPSVFVINDELHFDISQDIKIIDIDIINELGQIVTSSRESLVNGKGIITIPRLSKGIYIVRLKNENEIILSHKILR